MLKRLCLMIMCFSMFLCVACAKDGLDAEINTEFVTETESEKDSYENTEEVIVSEGIVYSELSADTLISDDEMKSKVLQLILDEKELIDTLGFKEDEIIFFF